MMQAHHLDTDYYDKFFRPGAYGPTHAEMASLVLRCIQMIQSQPNRLARPCAGYPRKPARRVPRLVDGRATPGHDD
jgi:hypothetical protein